METDKDPKVEYIMDDTKMFDIQATNFKTRIRIAVSILVRGKISFPLRDVLEYLDSRVFIKEPK